MTYDDMLRRRDQEKSSGAKDIDWDWRKHTGGIHESTSFPSKEKWDGNEEGQLGVSNLYDLPPNIFNKRVEEREAIISKLGKPNKAEAWAYKSWSFLFRPEGGKLSEGPLSPDQGINRMYDNPEGWRDYDPTEVMSFYYNMKGGLPPPSETPEWEANWRKVQAFLNDKFPIDEGTCGYGPNGVPGKTPGETKGIDADIRTRGMIKKLIQKEVKKLTIGKPPITPGK